MEDAIEKAIEAMAKKITADLVSNDALKFTQAALNLAHAKAVLADVKRLRA